MKQEERRSRSYEYILQSAQKTFGMYGYAETSLDQICSEYNISKGSIYHYFTSKSDLFLACAKVFFQKMEDWLDEKVPDCSKSSPAQKLQAYIICFSDGFQQCFEDFEKFTTFAVSPPKHLEKDIMKLYRPLEERTHIIISSAISEIKLRDPVTPDIAVEYILTLSWSYLTQQFHSHERTMDHDEQENYAKEIADMILFGVSSAAK